MRKRMKLLLASTATIAGLVGGVVPAHAAAKPQTDSGWAFLDEFFGGPFVNLPARSSCEPIDLPAGEAAHSAENTSASSTITFYRGRTLFGGCSGKVAVLGPGDHDTGYRIGTRELSDLGLYGARFYSST